jgi:hypothetical protein
MALMSSAMLEFLWLTYLVGRNRLSPLDNVLSAVWLVLASPWRWVAPNCYDETPMMSIGIRPTPRKLVV